MASPASFNHSAFDYESMPKIDLESPPEILRPYLRSLESFTDEELHLLRWKMAWKAMAREKQFPPDEFENFEKTIWGIRSGRGFGKTLLAANWLGQRACETPMLCAVVSPTHDDVRYTCFEGPTGLLSVIPGKLIADRNSGLPSITLFNGTFIRGFAGDTPERLRGPQHHCAWCLQSHSLVQTDRGEVEIKDVRVGDRVLTRSGFRRVLCSEKTGESVPVAHVMSGGSTILRGTLAHRVYTVERGFVPICELKKGQNLLSLKEEPIRKFRDESRITTVTESGFGRESSERGLLGTFIGKFTSDSEARSQMGGLFTTKTEILLTTTRKTLRRCLRGIISVFTDSVLELPIFKSAFAGNCREIDGEEKRREESFAPSAEKSFGLKDRIRARSEIIARRPVKIYSVLRDLIRTESAPDAEKLLSQIRELTISAVVEDAERADVYDLTVEGTPEYFADGVLVHNCDEIASWKYPDEAWDNLWFGLRLGTHPQVVWTGTPKPSPFIRKLTKDPNSVTVVGSTYENRDNLTQTFFDNVAKYEGTKIGRQELYGEILDPEEEGIVKRSQWRLWPCDKPLPKFESVVMSLDTAFTEKTHDKRKQENDPTACSVWGIFNHKHKKNVMLLDCWEEWLGLPDLIARVKRERKLTYGDADEPILRPKGVRKQDRPRHTGKSVDIILIEEKGSGISLKQTLAQEDIFAHGYNPGKADKLARLHITSPMWANGRVWVVESDHGGGKPKTWADPLITQCCSYIGEGSVDHDDYLDTTTQVMKFVMDKFIGSLTKTQVQQDEERREIARMKDQREKRRERGNPYG